MIFNGEPGGETVTDEGSVTHTGQILSIAAVVIVLAVGAYFAYTSYNKPVVIIPPEVVSKAAALNDSGDFKGAQAYLAEQIKAYPDASILKLYLANSILTEGSVRGMESVAAPKAREILLAVEKGGDDTVYLYDLLGYSYELVNDFDKAISYYDKALDLDGKSVNTLFSIGHTYWLKGDLAKTTEYYGKAEAAITDTTDKSVAVKVYVAQGGMNSDPKKSEAYFLKALPLVAAKAFKAELYADLSNTQFLQKNYAKAIEYADTAVTTDPSNELGYLAYARAVISDKTLLQKNGTKADAYLLKAVFLAPTKAETQYWVGKLDFATGRNALAIKSYDTARLLIPKDNTLTTAGRNALMADVLLDEAVVYFAQGNQDYKAFLNAAMKYNPVKVLYVLNNDPGLAAMKKGFLPSELLLNAAAALKAK